MMEIPTSLIENSIRRGTIIHSYGFTDIAEGTASIVGEMQAVHLSELLSATRESDLFTDYEKATYLRE